MPLIKVKATVHLPAAQNGKHVSPGMVFFVDPDDPFVATQLSVGHLVPIGPIPRITDDEPAEG